MSIHYVIPETIPDDDLMETLCNLGIKVSRVEDRITGFTTLRASEPIQCVFDFRDVNCKNCKREWRNLKWRTT